MCVYINITFKHVFYYLNIFWFSENYTNTQIKLKTKKLTRQMLTSNKFSLTNIQTNLYYVYKYN